MTQLESKALRLARAYISILGVGDLEMNYSLPSETMIISYRKKSKEDIGGTIKIFGGKTFSVEGSNSLFVNYINKELGNNYSE